MAETGRVIDMVCLSETSEWDKGDSLLDYMICWTKTSEKKKQNYLN